MARVEEQRKGECLLRFALTMRHISFAQDEELRGVRSTVDH